MKVEYEYTVSVTVNDEDGADVEKALRKVALEFDKMASVDETDAIELEDEESEE